MTWSDAELVKIAQAGDVTGLGVLLEHHRAPLYALAVRLLGHGPDAQDAVQDACVIALTKIDQLMQPDAAGAWLRAIVRNVCLSLLRERRDGTAGSVTFPVSQLAALPPPSTEDYIDRLALSAWVWTAIAQMPAPLRTTVILRYFGSYASYDEIAAILGVPIGTVRSRLNQAKTKLLVALRDTVAAAHDEALLTAEAQTRFFVQAHDELNGGRPELLASAFAEDVVLRYADGGSNHGLEVLRHHVWASQLTAGVKLHLERVLTSKDVTVIEGRFENPDDDPKHCPPATVIVFSYGDGKIRGLRQYYAPRPGTSHNHASIV